MGRVRDLLKKEAARWFFGRIGPGPAGEPVQPERAYLGLYLEAMHIRDVRVGAQTFYATVASSCTVESREGKPAELVVVSTPDTLRGADPKHLDRIVIGTVPLVDAVPYRGGGLGAEIGLFSFPGRFLVGPYLEFLGDVAAAATSAWLPVATALVAPVRKGLDLLFGAATDARLEVGLAHTWTEPVTGYYAVVRTPVQEPGFTLGTGAQLLNPDGTPVQEPYLVLRLDARPERHNWASIPDLQLAYQAIAHTVQSNNLSAAKEALAGFHRAALFSPDLLSVDAQRVYELVRDQVALALPTIGTSGAGAEHRLPDLADLKLYGSLSAQDTVICPPLGQRGSGRGRTASLRQTSTGDVCAGHGVCRGAGGSVL